jgi:hypothetical protein
MRQVLDNKAGWAHLIRYECPVIKVRVRKWTLKIEQLHNTGRQKLSRCEAIHVTNWRAVLAHSIALQFCCSLDCLTTARIARHTASYSHRGGSRIQASCGYCDCPRTTGGEAYVYRIRNRPSHTRERCDRGRRTVRWKGSLRGELYRIGRRCSTVVCTCVLWSYENSQRAVLTTTARKEKKKQQQSSQYAEPLTHTYLTKSTETLENRQKRTSSYLPRAQPTRFPPLASKLNR